MKNQNPKNHNSEQNQKISEHNQKNQNKNTERNQKTKIRTLLENQKKIRKYQNIIKKNQDQIRSKSENLDQNIIRKSESENQN